MNATALVKRPRTKPAGIRREELMDAAQALFLERGFADTSVDGIVRAADVAKGTFYVYFKTKEDVLGALRTRFVEGFCERLEGAVERCAPDDWAGRIDAWLEAAVTGYLDAFQLHDLVFHEFRPSNRQARQDNPVITRLTALIDAGARAGAWPVRAPRLTAAMLFSAFHGAVDEAIAAAGSLKADRLVAEVRAFCRQALGLPRA
jgi:AcrR family transcriptional regulator